MLADFSADEVELMKKLLRRVEDAAMKAQGTR
jgi:hypothetical protein